MLTACPLEKTPELNFYLCPERAISFDGFISYEAVDLVFHTGTQRKHAGFIEMVTIWRSMTLQ